VPAVIAVQERALPGETDHASVRVQFQKFLVMQIPRRASDTSITLKGLHFILIDPVIPPRPARSNPSTFFGSQPLARTMLS
jgi:hypothetical protein